jgi:uncharacterized protein (DUF58 family)
VDVGDDIVRVRQSSLIGLNRDARALPLISNSVKAQMAGGHQSAFRGRGMEFHESRPYQPGDDIRAIDWRVTARSSRTHTKVYREERERPVLLWLDLSRSMFFGTRQCFKSVLAAKLAALFAWSSVQHGDRLGYLAFSETQHVEFRPARGKRSVLHFIQQLVNHEAWSQFDRVDADPEFGVRALTRLRQVTRPGSLVIMISDFRFLAPSCRGQLAEIARHNDVILLHTYDPFERELPEQGMYRVTDGEHNVDIDCGNRSLREHYRQRYQADYDRLKRLSSELGLFLIDIATDADMLAELKAGLGMDIR